MGRTAQQRQHEEAEQRGALTDEEFAAAKAKLLGS
jgi:Short C-terminal domain